MSSDWVAVRKLSKPARALFRRCVVISVCRGTHLTQIETVYMYVALHAAFKPCLKRSACAACTSPGPRLWPTRCWERSVVKPHPKPGSLRGASQASLASWLPGGVDAGPPRPLRWPLRRPLGDAGQLLGVAIELKGWWCTCRQVTAAQTRPRRSASSRPRLLHGCYGTGVKRS